MCSKYYFISFFIKSLNLRSYIYKQANDNELMRLNYIHPVGRADNWVVAKKLNLQISSYLF